MKRKGPRRDAEKERFWRGVIRAQRQSGQSIREYCRANGLREPTFYAWRQELKRRSSQRASAGPRRGRLAEVRQCPPAGTRPRLSDRATFVPVRVAAEGVLAAGCALAGAAGIELALPSGAVLRWPAGVEPAAVAAVVSAWERSRC
jgi:hypothetical protein